MSEKETIFASLKHTKIRSGCHSLVDGKRDTRGPCGSMAGRGATTVVDYICRAVFLRSLTTLTLEASMKLCHSLGVLRIPTSRIGSLTELDTVSAYISRCLRAEWREWAQGGVVVRGWLEGLYNERFINASWLTIAGCVLLQRGQLLLLYNEFDSGVFFF